MLSSRYVYKSNALRDRYIEDAINYEDYMSYLEAIKDEELKSVYFESSKPEMLQEIYAFKDQQLSFARQVREQNKMEKREVERRQREYEEHQKKIKEEEDRIKTLTPEEKLYEEREKYYKSDVPLLIEEYKRESKQYRNTHDRLQWTIIIGSAVVTSMTSITIFISLPIFSYALKGFAAFCSLIVTIVASFISYFKYRERSMNLQHAADDIEYEYEAVKYGTDIYQGKPRDEALGMFANRIISRKREQKEQQRILEQPSEVKQIQP